MLTCHVSMYSQVSKELNHKKIQRLCVTNVNMTAKRIYNLINNFISQSQIKLQGRNLNPVLKTEQTIQMFPAFSFSSPTVYCHEIIASISTLFSPFIDSKEPLHSAGNVFVYWGEYTPICCNSPCLNRDQRIRGIIAIRRLG